VTDLEANRKLVQDQWDAFNRGDMAGAAECFAEDTCNHGRPVGRAGVLAVLRDIWTTFPDVRFEPLAYITDGEWVALRGMFSGTHRGIGRIPVNGGMLVGVDPTGRRFEVQHICRTVFEPALIAAGINTVTITTETVRVRAGKGVREVAKQHRRVQRTFRWKGLRHTFGSWLRRKGVELGTAVERLSGLIPAFPMARGTSATRSATSLGDLDTSRSLERVIPRGNA
jgi:predicted ester cyclase